MQFQLMNQANKKYFFLASILLGLIILFSVIEITNHNQMMSNAKKPVLMSSEEDKKTTSFNVGADSSSSAIKPLSGATLLPKDAYKDGTYTGFSATSSGVLVIKITIQLGKLTNISFLTVPKGDYANTLDTLAQEAIQKQVVEVSPVNEYDDISIAFNKALGDAIKKSFKI